MMTNRGLGQLTAAQFQALQNAVAAQTQAIVTAAQAGKSPSEQLQAAQAATAQVQAAQAALNASLAVQQQAAAAAAAPSSTPYIIAGIVGVAVLGGLVYYATR